MFKNIKLTKLFLNLVYTLTVSYFNLNRTSAFFILYSQGIQGVISSIDSNGDAEGNYTLLARVPYVSQHANFSMQPVGHFLIGSKLPVSVFHADTNQQSLKNI